MEQITIALKTCQAIFYYPLEILEAAVAFFFSILRLWHSTLLLLLTILCGGSPIVREFLHPMAFFISMYYLLRIAIKE
jgi:hypothetical protein